jgi:RNA polymerase sigma factor (sigma-70 family)
MFSEAGFRSIIEGARGGADWAWTALYRDLSPVVLRYLRAHRAHEPEDVLGEVFVQVVRQLPSFVGEERDFRAWVLTIARSRLIDEWRRACRNPVDCTPDDVLAACAETVDAEEDTLRPLADEHARAIIERLSRDQRDVLFLRLFAGLTVAEVAGVVGKSTGAVKALQARGLAAIRRATSREAVTL